MGRKEPGKVQKRDPRRLKKNEKNASIAAEEIILILKEMITRSDWFVRSYSKKNILFTTPSLQKAIPNKGDHQRLDNAIFVFEIKISTTLSLTTKVFPGDEQTRQTILKALSGLDILNKRGRRDGLIIHTWYETDFIGKEKDKIKKMLKEVWDKIAGEVIKVEEKLLKQFKDNVSPLSKDSRKIRAYLKIIDFVRERNESGFYPKVADMIEYLAKSGIHVSPRTVQRYLYDLNNEFLVYIDQQGKHGGYKIIMDEIQNFNEVYESFTILEKAGYFNGLFTKSKKSLQYISFDGKQFTGYRHFKTILDAIVQSRVIEITHKKFDGEENQREVRPYLLKEYNNRWYLVGYDYNSKEMRTFGLDRISKIKITEEIFDNTKIAEVKDNFKDVIGIVSNKQPEKVVLKFDNSQIEYFRTYPWHKSAQISKNENGEWIVSMFVSVNYELQQLILMNHSQVQVLKPEHLVESIKELVGKALKKYG